MSYAAVLDNGDAIDVGTTAGWPVFRRKVEARSDVPELKTLVTKGASESLGPLLKDALKLLGDGCADALVQLLRRRGDATSVIVSDGVGDEDDDTFELSLSFNPDQPRNPDGTWGSGGGTTESYKDKVETWNKSLTKDESRAVSRFHEDGTVNKELLSALKKAPVYQGDTIYRGVDELSPTDFKVGQEYQSDRVSFATSSEAEGARHAGEGVLLHIQGHTDARVLEAGGENAVAIRGTHFYKVEKIEGNNVYVRSVKYPDRSKLRKLDLSYTPETARTDVGRFAGELGVANMKHSVKLPKNQNRMTIEHANTALKQLGVTLGPGRYNNTTRETTFHVKRGDKRSEEITLEKLRALVYRTARNSAQ